MTSVVPAVVDSGPLLAALNRADRHHAVATRTLRALRGAAVPDPVLVEVDVVARRWLGDAAARRFLEAVQAGVHRRVALDEALFARAVAIDVRYADLGLGLVDTAVMAVAERLEARVCTFDFRAFRAVPGPSGGGWPLVLDERDLAGRPGRR